MAAQLASSPREDAHNDELHPLRREASTPSELGFALDDETVIRRRTEGGSFDEDQLSKEGIRDLCSIIALTSLNFAYGSIGSTMGLHTLPAEALRMFPETSSLALGIFLGINGLSQLICPILGNVSDAWESRLGKRRPFVLLGCVVTAISSLAMRQCSLEHQPVAFTVALLLAMLGLNTLYTAQTALVPDLVAPDAQGLASGLVGCQLLFGAVGGFTFVSRTAADDFHVVYLFYFAELLLFTTIVFCVGREPKVKKGAGWFGKAAEGTLNFRQLLRSMKIDKSISPDFFYVAVSRTFYYIGVSCQAFIVFFIRDVLGTLDEHTLRTQVAIVVVVGQVTAGLVALPVGKLSDRLGRKPAIYISAIVMSATYYGFLSAHYFGEFRMTAIYVISAFYGLGNGCYLAVDYALALDCLPSKETAGKDLGVWGISAFVGSAIGPMLWGVELMFFPCAEGAQCTYSYWGYFGMMSSGVVAVLYSAYVVSWVRTTGPMDCGKSPASSPAKSVELE
jgi:MFS family permease